MRRLVQLNHPQHGRRVAVVEENGLRLLRGHDSIYGLAQASNTANKFLEQTVNASLGFEVLDYDAVHGLKSEWRLLPAFDHPEEPARCLVSGAGLTHKASAENRQAMDAENKPAVITDSVRIYNDTKVAKERCGEAGGCFGKMAWFVRI